MELCSLALALALLPSSTAPARPAPSAQDTAATQDAIGVRLLAAVLPDDWLEPVRQALSAPQTEDQDLELPSADSSPLLWANTDEDLAAATAEEFTELASLVPSTTRILVLTNADRKATLRAVGAAGHPGLLPMLEEAFAGSDPKTTLDQAIDDLAGLVGTRIGIAVQHDEFPDVTATTQDRKVVSAKVDTPGPW